MDSSNGIDGFHTSGEEILSFPLRFLHPLCQFAFWFSGMYEGGSFDRKYINAAASVNIPFVGEPVESIVRKNVKVPKKWPLYEGDSWKTYNVNMDELNEIYEMSVIIFTPLGVDDCDELPILVSFSFWFSFIIVFLTFM